jgi:hypothetical protein
MKIKMIVKAKRSWSRLHRAVVQDVVRCAINEFGLMGSGTVTVKLMGDSSEQSGAMVSKGEDNYIIWIHADTSLKHLIETTFHEMTHVKQDVAGEFPCDEDEIDTDTTSPRYWNSPWEVEARYLGKKMRRAYLKA